MRKALDYSLLRAAIALKAGRCQDQAEAIIALASTAEQREKMSEAMIFAAVAQNELTPEKAGRYGRLYSSASPTVQAVLAGLRPEDVVEIDEAIRSGADPADGAKAGFAKMIDLKLPMAAGTQLVNYLIDQRDAGPDFSASL